jgi:hypothetical protein
MPGNLSRRLDALTKTALPGHFEVRYTDQDGRRAAHAAIDAECETARRAGAAIPNVLLVVFEDPSGRETAA